MPCNCEREKSFSSFIPTDFVADLSNFSYEMIPYSNPINVIFLPLFPIKSNSMYQFYLCYLNTSIQELTKNYPVIHPLVFSCVWKYYWLDPSFMHTVKNFSSWWVMLCPFQLNRSAQFPVHAVQSLLFEEATNRVNHVALTPFRVKVSLCLNIFKMLKVKSEAFSTKQLASINFVWISSGKTKFSMASCPV